MENINKEIVLELISNSEIELSSTHTKLSLPIINRIYRKMLANLKIPAIKVQDNLICDGHHRYIASLLANYQLERISWVSSAASIIIDWETVSLDEHDWDTPEEINLRNRQDVAYNDMPVAKIIALLE